MYQNKAYECASIRNYAAAERHFNETKPVKSRTGDMGVRRATSAQAQSAPLSTEARHVAGSQLLRPHTLQNHAHQVLGTVRQWRCSCLVATPRQHLVTQLHGGTPLVCA
jgi:hypothetical protein